MRKHNNFQKEHLESTAKPYRNDLITIIIICYNECSKRIKFTFESIIRQSYKFIEIIVIDGGSNDATLNSLNVYSEYISCLVSEPDQGIYDAMNKGLTFANGDWIIFMNIGDRFHSPETLTHMLNRGTMNGNPSLIYGHAALFSSLNKAYIEQVPKKIKRWFLYKGTICHQAMLIKKSAFKSVGLFDLSYQILSDKDWLFRFIENKLPYQNCDIIVCDWDTKGATSNTALFDHEFIYVVKKRYTKIEQFAFVITWFFIKITRRLRLFNFSFPYRLKLRNYYVRQ